MPELKTQRNEGDVDAFINSVEDDVRRRDAAEVKEIMTRLSGQPPTMWGDSIVGFGSYSYQSGGRNHEWFKVGSPHASSTSRSPWVMDARRNGNLLDLLGPHGKGKACLYVKDLRKVDRGVVEDLVIRSLHQFDASA